MLHPLHRRSLHVEVHGAEGLRLEGDAGGPAAAGAAAGTRLYCVVAGGPLRMRTRSLPRCTDPAWHEVFVFKEDEVLMSGLATSFEVVTTRRWGSDLALAQADVVLSSQDLDGITRSGRLALRLPLRTKQGRKEAAAAAASTAAPPPPPPFGELRITLSFGDPGASQESKLLLQLPDDMAPRCFLDARRLAPGAVAHCSGGTLYVEPRRLLLRLTVVKAEGLSKVPGVDDGAAPSSSRATAGAQAASSSGGGGHGGGSGLAARLAPPELRHQAAALLQRGATWLVNRRRNRGATAGRGGGTSAGAAGSSSAAAAATAEDETAPLQRVDSVGHIALRRSSLLATLKETPPPSPLRPMAQPRQLLEPITPTLVPVDIGAGTEAGVKGEAERVEPLDQESGGSEVDNLEAAASADDFEGGGDGTSSAAGELRTSPPTADHVISRLENMGFHSVDDDAPTTTAQQQQQQQHPAGSGFYCIVSYEGQSFTTAVSPARGGGAAVVWGDTFVMAAHAPLDAASAALATPLALELVALRGPRLKSKTCCTIQAPLGALLLLQQQQQAAAAPPSAPPPPLPSSPLQMFGLDPATVRWPSAELVVSGSSAEDGGTVYVTLRVEVIDAEHHRTPAGEAAARVAAAPASREQQAQQKACVDDDAAATAAATTMAAAAPRRTNQETGSGQQPLESVTPSSSPLPRPYLGTVHVVVHDFADVDAGRQACDCFFMMQLGSQWFASSAAPVPAGGAPLSPAWGTYLQLPLEHPSQLLSLALFRQLRAKSGQLGGGGSGTQQQDGAAGGGASAAAPRQPGMLDRAKAALGAHSDRLLGKLRLRMSTLSPGQMHSCTLPLWAERSTMRANSARACSVHVSLFVHYPSLPTYIASYFQPQLPPSELMLLAQMHGSAAPAPAASGGGRLTQERLQRLHSELAVRWLAGLSPPAPPRLAQKLVDDGRRDFYLSRVQQNWRRLRRVWGLVAVPLGGSLSHVQSWRNPLHSGLAVVFILLLVTYPSRVIAACLLLFAGCLGRAMSTAPSRDGRTALGAPMPMLPDLAPITAEDKGAAAAPPGGDVGDGGEDGGGVDDVLGGSMPPPPSPGPGLSGGGGGSGAGAAGSPAPAPLPQAGAGGAVAGGGGLDPLASLRRQYNAVTREVQRIQNILDTIAGWLERGEALMTWQDPLASSLLLLLLALLAGAFWLLGARTIVAAWLLWTIRPPALRQPLPPPPANFVANLPTRSDRMM